MTSLRRLPIGMGLLLLLAAASPGHASGDGDGGTRSVFAFGAGNRALSMGGGYVAAADDASSLVWNPGGLGRVNRSEFQFTDFHDPVLDMREMYGAFVMPSWRWGTLGVAARQFGTAGIEQRDSENVLLSSDLTYAESELTLGYGRPFGEALGVGASVKLQRQSLAGYSANGIGMDIGVSLKPGALLMQPDSWLNGLQVGVTARNAVEPSLRLDRESVPDPATLRGGLAYQLPLGWGWVLATADVEKARGMDARLHTGLEIAPTPGAAARVGLDDGRLTAGIGMRWRDLSMDYAYMDRTSATDHRVGVTLHFGSSVEASRIAARKAEDDALQSRLAEAFRRQHAEQIATLLDRAERERASGRFDQALETILAIGTLAPDDPRLARLESQCLIGKATALEKSGDFPAAAMTFDLATRSGTKDPAAVAGAIRCRAESDRRAKRSADLRQRFAVALDAFGRDDLAAARAGFLAVLAVDSLDSDARSMLKRTVEASRRRAERLISQAAAAIAAGALGDAPTLLDQAALLDIDAPRLAAVRASLTRARASATDAARVKSRDSQSASAAAPVPRQEQSMSEAELEALYRRGLDAARRQRPDEAMRYWELVWNAKPGYRQVTEYLKREYLTRGMEAFAAGRLEAAVTHWRNVLRIDPNDARAGGYLARAQQQIARSREILGATP